MYVIVLPLIVPAVTVPFAAVDPNFNPNVGAVPVTVSLYVATIVISCPALYVPVAGLVAFILLKVGAVVSQTIVKTVIPLCAVALS